MQFENAIICDEIREEKTGKYFLIGVYRNTIQTPEFPVDMTVSAFLAVLFERNGKYTIEFRYAHNKKQLIGGRAECDVRDYKSSVIMSLPAAHIQIQKEGVLALQMREIGKNWRTLKRLYVELR